MPYNFSGFALLLMVTPNKKTFEICSLWITHDSIWTLNKPNFFKKLFCQMSFFLKRRSCDGPLMFELGRKNIFSKIVWLIDLYLSMNDKIFWLYVHFWPRFEKIVFLANYAIFTSWTNARWSRWGQICSEIIST